MNKKSEIESILFLQMKKYKFELQKAVNTPVNAISRVSGSHLRDKLQRLVSLLSRQQVDIGANKRVSIATHPAAYDFCKDLLTKKIVVSVRLVFSYLICSQASCCLMSVETLTCLIIKVVVPTVEKIVFWRISTNYLKVNI